MKVVCKKKTIEGDELKEIVSYKTDSLTYPITLGQEYFVMGLSINKYSSCLYYLIGDAKPFWYPYSLFDTLDNSLPNNWYIEILDKNSEGTIRYLQGFYELCNNEDYHDALMEREPWAMEIYFQRRQEYLQWQASGENYQCPTLASPIKEVIIWKLTPCNDYAREQVSPRYISNEMHILEKFLKTDIVSPGASHIIHHLEKWYVNPMETTTGFNIAVISKKLDGKVALNYEDIEGSKDLIISFDDLITIAKTWDNLRSNYIPYVIIEHENERYSIRGIDTLTKNDNL